MLKRLLRFLWKVGPRVLLPSLACFYAIDVGRLVLIWLGAPLPPQSGEVPAARWVAEAMVGIGMYVLLILLAVGACALAKWLKAMWDKS